MRFPFSPVLIMLRKCCMLGRKTSGSPFLKDVAQTKTMSLLFPSYELVWAAPAHCQELLFLDTAVNPLNLNQDFSWVGAIPVVKSLPGLSKPWSKLLGRIVEEVTF